MVFCFKNDHQRQFQTISGACSHYCKVWLLMAGCHCAHDLVRQQFISSAITWAAVSSASTLLFTDPLPDSLLQLWPSSFQPTISLFSFCFHGSKSSDFHQTSFSLTLNFLFASRSPFTAQFSVICCVNPAV